MSVEWRTKPLSSLLSSSFAGEWGLEPTKSANAFALRSTNLSDDCSVDYSTAAPRLILKSKLTTKMLRQGDILLEASGGSPTKPVGRVGFFAPPDGRTYIVSNFFKTLRPNSEVFPRFLFWQLVRNYRLPEIWRYQQQTTGLVNLKFGEFREQDIPLPPLPEQRRIAAILDTLDRTIEGTHRVIEKLQATRQGHVNMIATQYLSGQAASLQTLVRAGDVTLGRGQIISHPTMAAFPGNYPVYSSSAAGNGEMGRYGRYMFDEELITWSVDGGGKFFYRPKHRFSITNVSGFMRVRTSRYNARFAFLLLDHQHSKMQFDYTLKAHPSVIDTLYYLPLGVNVQEQDALAGEVALFDTKLVAEQAQLNKLLLLKQGLMDDLLTGRVRVPVADAEVGA